jgi:hypothetical protein
VDFCNEVTGFGLQVGGNNAKITVVEQAPHLFHHYFLLPKEINGRRLGMSSLPQGLLLVSTSPNFLTWVHGVDHHAARGFFRPDCPG